MYAKKGKFYGMLNKGLPYKTILLYFYIFITAIHKCFNKLMTKRAISHPFFHPPSNLVQLFSCFFNIY